MAPPVAGRPRDPRWGRRLAWFAALWAAGVLAVGGGAYLLRAVILHP